MAGTPIWILLRTVFESILEVFLLCFAGWFLAKQEILDKKTQKQLNRLNVSLFTPSLLFSKVAFSLSPAKLRELWIIPLFFVLVTGVSWAVAQVMGRMFRLKPSQRAFATAACMFMNSNSLPIALMQSLTVTVPHLKWGNDDSKSAMLGRALTYLVLFSTLSMILRWSYGVHILTNADDTNVKPPPQPQLQSPTERQTQTQFKLSSPPEDENTEPALDAPPLSPTRRPPPPEGINPASHMFYSFPNTPIRSRINVNDNLAPPSRSPSPSASTSDDEEPLRFSHARVHKPTTNKHLRRSSRRIKRFFIALNEFMTIPLYASLSSLVVALIPPLQHLLEEHTTPLKGALLNAGGCSIPLTLVVLGAYFYTPDEDVKEYDVYGREIGWWSRSSRRSRESVYSFVGSLRGALKMRSREPSGVRLPDDEDDEVLPSHMQQSSTSTTSNGTALPPPARPRPPQNRRKSLLSARKDAARPGEGKTVFVAVVSRMIIVPLALFPLFAAGVGGNWHAVFDDPVFVVSSVLLVSSPPALTLAQITQKASGDAFERLISRTIFWAYCILTPVTSIGYVVLGLWLSKL